MSTPFRAEAVIDLDAVRRNVQALLRVARAQDPGVQLMAVVKADGYGHGAEQVARAARAAGAVAIGVATPDEATALTAVGLRADADRPLVAWLWVPDQPIGPAVAAGTQLVVSSAAQFAAVLDVAALAPGGRADIHLKIDTGLGRGGATPDEFARLAARAAEQERAGLIRVVGLMSHLASADVPGDPSVPLQIEQFRQGWAVAHQAGLRPRWRHLANSPGTIGWPQSRFDLVRCGIGVYGISPFQAQLDNPFDVGSQTGPDAAVGSIPEIGLTPAMTLLARVALTKRVPAGHGVSYGLTYRTTGEATLALVPVGYADGIPRNAGPTAEVLLAGRRRRIAGRIAMDQFVVDCGDDEVAAGDEVVIFGPGTNGEPTADDWAIAAGTIAYEIVTRVGVRVPRRYVGQPSAVDPDTGSGPIDEGST